MPEKLASGPRVWHDLSKVSAGLSRGPNLQRKLTAAPWSGTWPAPGSTLDLDFSNNRGWVRGRGQGGVMDAITFTRGSTGRYIDSVGLLQAATDHVPRFDWASTDRTGSGTIASPYVIPLAAASTCNGILIEESRANRLLWCRDATQSGSWTCTNVTPLKDQTGIDGVANAASSLTASADGGTCIQTITLASGSRTGSVYLKRLTGTGNVQVSLDGSTWSTVDLSSTEWRRIVMSGTVTNPVVGIKLAVNGDAVAMDYGQVEDGAFATSPILTTSASATRSADLASMSNMTWLNRNEGTMTATVSISRPNSVGWVAVAMNISNDYFGLLFGNSGTARRFTVSSFGTTYNADISPVSTSPVTYRIAGSYKKGNVFASSNGLTSSTVYPPSIPLPIRLDIGSEFNQYLNGWISSITYFPKSVTQNATLEMTR